VKNARHFASSAPSESSIFDDCVKRRCLLRFLAGSGVAGAVWPWADSLSAVASTFTPLKIRIAVAKLRTIHHLPLVLAQELGFFQAENLHTELIEFDNEHQVFHALLQGKADIGLGNYTTLLTQQLRGVELSGFLLVTRSPLVAMGVSLKTLGHYRDLHDLKGRRIGLLTPSPIGGWLASTLLQQVGLQLSDMVQVTRQHASDLLEQYRLGLLDALSVVDPLMTTLEQRGEIRVIADTRSLRSSRDIFGGDMPGEMCCATPDFQRQHPAVCLAVSHAMVRALKWLQTAGPSDLIKVIPDAHFDGDRTAYLLAFEKLRDGFSSDGLMSSAAASTALQTLTRINRDLRPTHIALDRTYTNEFAQKTKQKFKT
jgi:NitT/TauT family transport system substrate-binding protein